MDRRTQVGSLVTAILVVWWGARFAVGLYTSPGLHPDLPPRVLLQALEHAEHVKWFTSAAVLGASAALASVLRGHVTPGAASAGRVPPEWTGEVDRESTEISGRLGRPDPFLPVIQAAFLGSLGSVIVAVTGSGRLLQLLLTVVVVAVVARLVRGRRPGPVVFRCDRDKVVVEGSGGRFSESWDRIRSIRATAETLEIEGGSATLELDFGSEPPERVAGLAADLEQRRIRAGKPSPEERREASRVAGLAGVRD